MKINSKISTDILGAVSKILEPYIPELTATPLVKALKTFEHTQEAHTQPAVPLTRKEAAALLKVSLPTIHRFIRAGLLTRVKIGQRLVRITPESVENLLAGDRRKEAEA